MKDLARIGKPPIEIVAANRKPRQGWDDAFRAARAQEDEFLLWRAAPNEFDANEWQWCATDDRRADDDIPRKARPDRAR